MFKPVKITPMFKYSRILILLFAVCVFSSCSQISESVKVILGTSTRGLQKARETASVAKYSCDIDSCMDVVLGLAREGNDQDPYQKKIFDVFREDRIRAVIVAMGIEGSVDTTEVGIFFSKHTSQMTQVDVASLSSSAQRRVAEAVFEELDLYFSRK